MPTCLPTGYRDDDDGVLADLETAAEGERLAELTSAWDVEQKRRRQIDPEGVAAEERDLRSLLGNEGTADAFVAHVAVPDQKAIKQAVLARRKQELLEKLANSAATGTPIESAPRVESLDTIKRLPPSW